MISAHLFPNQVGLDEDEIHATVCIRVGEFYGCSPMEVETWPATWVAATMEFMRARNTIEKFEIEKDNL